MRRQDIESELAYVQNCLNDIADKETMRATSSGINPLKGLAFRIGCCRAALDAMEGANLHPPTPQGQNGTAGKPQVGECTTSAIG